MPHLCDEISTTAMYLLLCCLYLSSIYYRSEAVSLTCSNTTASACPNTEVTLCTCITTSLIQSWTLPGGEQITLGAADGVGDERTDTDDGSYTVTITDDTGGRESVLTYTATTTLMDVSIVCADLASVDPAVTDTVTVTFAGKE